MDPSSSPVVIPSDPEPRNLDQTLAELQKQKAQLDSLEAFLHSSARVTAEATDFLDGLDASRKLRQAIQEEDVTKPLS